MSWWTDRHVFLLAVIAYGLSAVYSLFLWRKGFREHDYVNYGLLLAGMILQTKAMFMRGLTLKECPVHNLYEAMTFVDWTIVAVYLVIGLWPRVRYLGAFASPVIFAIGVFALMPGLDPAHTAPAAFRGQRPGQLARGLDAALLRRIWVKFGGRRDVPDPGTRFEISQVARRFRAHAARLIAWKKSPAGCCGPDSCS